MSEYVKSLFCSIRYWVLNDGYRADCWLCESKGVGSDSCIESGATGDTWKYAHNSPAVSNCGFQRAIVHINMLFNVLVGIPIGCWNPRKGSLKMWFSKRHSIHKCALQRVGLGSRSGLGSRRRHLGWLFTGCWLWLFQNHIYEMCLLRTFQRAIVHRNVVFKELVGIPEKAHSVFKQGDCNIIILLLAIMGHSNLTHEWPTTND